MGAGDDRDVPVPDLPAPGDAAVNGLRPIPKGLEPEVSLLVMAIREIFDQLGMTLGQLRTRLTQAYEREAETQERRRVLEQALEATEPGAGDEASDASDPDAASDTATADPPHPSGPSDRDSPADQPGEQAPGPVVPGISPRSPDEASWTPATVKPPSGV
jgi:hypothetical protein